MSGNKVSLALGVVCVCLIGGLIYRHTQAIQKETASRQKIQEIETELTETTVDLGNAKQTNVVLRTELQLTSSELSEIREQYQALAEDLESEKAKANAAVLETRTALEEVADRDVQIKELTKDREDLSNRVETLNASMGELETQVARF